MISARHERYFLWLCEQAGSPRCERRGRSYRDMLSVLFCKEFVWLISVPNDDNRVEEAIDLRMEFEGEVDFRMPQGCSVLEVIVALSRRMAFLTDEPAEDWAWKLIENLGLHKRVDPLSSRKKANIDDILDDLIWRRYDRDGSGGFFPLAWPHDDQRGVELWYQMNAYIEERYEP